MRDVPPLPTAAVTPKFGRPDSAALLSNTSDLFFSALVCRPAPWRLCRREAGLRRRRCGSRRRREAATSRRDARPASRPLQPSTLHSCLRDASRRLEPSLLLRARVVRRHREQSRTYLRRRRSPPPSRPCTCRQTQPLTGRRAFRLLHVPRDPRRRCTLRRPAARCPHVLPAPTAVRPRRGGVPRRLVPRATRCLVMAT